MEILTSIFTPAASALLGGLMALGGAWLAVKVDIAVLRTQIKNLSELVRHEVDDLKSEIDDAHARIDRVLLKDR